MNPARRILLADDDPRDVELFLLAMEELDLHGRVDVVQDGEAVLDYLERNVGHDLPAVLFLDLKMPKLGGLEVLNLIRADPGLRPMPVVVFTSSMQERDQVESRAAGADGYVVKPLDFKDYMATVEHLGTHWVLGSEVGA